MAYEVSTAGDRRFSALVATLEDGRTVEMHYQCDIKGYCPGGRDWRAGKGKPPLEKMSRSELYDLYKGLWRRWAVRNPQLMQELRELREQHGGLSDRFARRGGISQATALSELLDEMK